MAAQLDPFAGAEDIFAIAISGAMNPAIHHPAWYAFIGAVRPEETSGPTPAPVEVSPGAVIQIQADQAFCSAQLSQFTVERLRVMCVPERWTILTTEASQLSRIRDIADKVFAALMHTPINGYTLSFAHNRHTPLADVGEHLAKAMHSAHLGILRVEDAKELAQLRYIARSAPRDLTVDLQPSAKAKGMVYIGITFVHRLATPKEFQTFDLGPLLTDALAKDRPEAEEWVTNIVNAFTTAQR